MNNRFSDIYSSEYKEHIKKLIENGLFFSIHSFIMEQYPDFCKMAVKKNKEDIIYVPEKVLEDDYEFYINIIKENPNLLLNVHKKFVNKYASEFINLVDIDPGYLKVFYADVKKDYPEVCIRALKKMPSLISVIGYDIQLLYPDECKKIVEENVKYVKYLSPSLLTSDLSLEGIKNDYISFERIPSKILTYEICLEYAKRQPIGFSILKIPKNFLDGAIYYEIFKNNMISYYDIPPDALNYDIYLEALKRKIITYESIPEKYIDEKMWIEIVKQDGMAIKNIPSEIVLNNFEISLYAILNNKNALKYVPIKFKEKFRYMRMVLMNGLSIKSIDEEKLDSDICLAAVKQNSKSIEFIPNKYITDEIVKIALDGGYSNIKYLPERYKTFEICLNSVKHDINLIKFVPTKFKEDVFYEYYVYMISENKISVKDIDKGSLTYKLCLFIVNNFGYDLQYIPLKYKSYELCLTAIKDNPYAIKFVPDELITGEIYDFAYKNFLEKSKLKDHTSIILQDIPEKLKTEEMCLAAIKSEVLNIKYISIALKNKNFYLEVVRKVPRTFKLIDDEYKTKEMCDIALEYNFNNIKYVPEGLIDYDMSLKIIKNNYMLHRYIPENLIKDEIYDIIYNKYLELAEIREDIEIPKFLMNESFYLNVIKSNYKYVLSIPLELFVKKSFYEKTMNLKNEAVKNLYNTRILLVQEKISNGIVLIEEYIENYTNIEKFINKKNITRKHFEENIELVKIYKKDLYELYICSKENNMSSGFKYVKNVSQFIVDSFYNGVKSLENNENIKFNIILYYLYTNLPLEEISNYIKRNYSTSVYFKFKHSLLDKNIEKISDYYNIFKKNTIQYDGNIISNNIKKQVYIFMRNNKIPINENNLEMTLYLYQKGHIKLNKVYEKVFSYESLGKSKIIDQLEKIRFDNKDINVLIDETDDLSKKTIK